MPVTVAIPISVTMSMIIVSTAIIIMSMVIMPAVIIPAIIPLVMIAVARVLPVPAVVGIAYTLLVITACKAVVLPVVRSMVVPRLAHMVDDHFMRTVQVHPAIPA